MKILSVDQLRQADKYTIDNEPISSLNLMERAATKCADWILENHKAINLNTSTVVQLLCGMGNNGGDGLVIARKLCEAGYIAEVILLMFSEKGSDDFEHNLTKVNELKIKVVEVGEKVSDFKLKKEGLLIDAVFGSGLSRPVEGWLAEVFEKVNKSQQFVLSIDMPSGLFDGLSDNKEGAVISSDVTLTFESPKLSFLLPSKGSLAGDFMVLDIGLNKDFIDKQEVNYHFLLKKEVAVFLKKRGKFSYKNSNGHALIIGGSLGKVGALILSSHACIRSGAGLVTSYGPSCAIIPLQSSLAEVMAIADPGEEYISTAPMPEAYNAVAIGPGIGKDQQTANALKLLIQNVKSPLVIDADAINILAENKTWLSFLAPGCIFTPHPGEFKRLVGEWEDEGEKLEILKNFAIKYECYVVLKGAHTITACPDSKLYFNSSGNPGMATAGSGDVLTGIITGLKAQGYSSKISSLLGVYIHGLAGDLAADEKGETAMISGDIIQKLPAAFQILEESVNY